MINKIALINLTLILFFIFFNIYFIEKKPLYNDKNLSEVINYISKNTEKESVIQTNFEPYENFVWISPLIRIISNRNIFFDNSFTFNLEDANEWLRRKKIVVESKELINSSNPKRGFCKLKKNYINYYVSTLNIDDKFLSEIIDFKNNKFYIYNFNKISFKDCNY